MTAFSLLPLLPFLPAPHRVQNCNPTLCQESAFHDVQR